MSRKLTLAATAALILGSTAPALAQDAAPGARFVVQPEDD